MEKTLELPAIEDFYSSLSEEKISPEDHAFAQKVWKQFKIKNLKEYCELYCRIDNLVLSEIFTKFRATMMDFSGLDPAHYVSLPGYAWDSMLKVTECCIELPTDIEMVNYIEKGIRGGLSFINTRHAKIGKSSGEILSEAAENDMSIQYIDANVSKFNFKKLQYFFITEIIFVISTDFHCLFLESLWARTTGTDALQKL